MPDARSSQVRAAAGGSSRHGLPSHSSPNMPDSADGSSVTPRVLDDELTVISSRGPITDLDDGPLLKPLEASKMLEGERLGQFVLQKYVGGGGMGVVFKALDTTLNREVAVKVLARSQSQDEENLRRFQNEAQSAARLDHGNIARVYYVGQDRGVHYIVFEFIEGINIRDLVQQNGPLPLADAVSYTLQVAEALGHASQRDVIHRDIKPSNVLITPDGKAKLVDMGLARLLQVEHADHELTASGVTLGTFDYISPEQARDPRSADVRSDLYSLGCSFYFMLTGRPPFPEGTVLQKLLQHQGDDPPDPRNFRPDLPAEVTSILARLLAKNPNRRYQQPAELIAVLSDVGERAGLPSTAFAVNYRPQANHPWLQAWFKHLPWIVPLAALILIVLALDYLWSGSNAADASAESDMAPSRSQAAPPAPRAPGAQQRPTKAAQPVASTRGTVSPGSIATESALLGRAQPPKSSDPPGPTEVAERPRTRLPQEEFAPPTLPSGSFSQWLTSMLDRGQRGLNHVQDLFSTIPVDEALAAQTNAANQNLSGPTGSAGSNVAGSNAAGSVVGSKPSVPRPGVLIVAPDRQGTGIFSSLMSAVNAAKAGDVIELDFDGRREERPLTLSNTTIKIKAAEGRRPVIAFRPADADPVGYPRSMVTVAGGSLTITGVQWELDVPRKISADAWTLIETRRAELVRIEHAVLTIRNASSGGGGFHPAVAFFEAKAPPGSESMTMKTSSMPTSSIELADTLVRGEATILRSDELESVRLEIANTLLTTTETILLSRGASGAVRTGAATQIDLRQVTALALGGLVRMTNDEDSSHLLAMDIRADDSLLIVAANNPLVDQRGVEAADQFQELLHWHATHTVFAAADPFWRMTDVTTGKTTDRDFSEWEAFWGASSESECWRVLWPQVVESAGREPLNSVMPGTLATSLRQTMSADSFGDAQIGCNLNVLPAPVAEALDRPSE